jgi:RNA polymerase sigma factor (sigma-70 family)
MKNHIFGNQTDEYIVNLITHNHRSDLYEILFERYHSKVFDKCYSLLKDKKLAEEFVHDIFTKVFEKLKGYKGLSSFSSWLYAITYNHCIEYLRVKKKIHYPDWNRENELSEIIDEQEEDLTDIRYERLLLILDMIHPEEKALLLMKYKDNLSVKLIESALKISESAAKMRLKRAKARVIFLYNKLYRNKE